MSITKVSIIIPVKDGGTELVRCLAAIGSQELDREVEVVVIDSGSADASVAVAAAAGAQVIEVAPEDFNHGTTRNLGAEAASGDVLAFLSQDAEPAGLSTVRQPAARKGREADELLLAGAPELVVKMHHELILRTTTGPAPT